MEELPGLSGCRILWGEKCNIMSIREKYQITEYCHHFLREYIHEGDHCIDATCGKGCDTEFLCRSVGKTGRVYGFDIQREAVEQTRIRLERAGCADQAVLICDGHEKMADYVKDQAAVIMFNFGYLPGGDHSVATRPRTSLKAVQEGLDLLKTGGVMSLCIYSGGDTGYEEKNTLLAYLKGLDTKYWLVIVHSYYNRRNDPPLPVFVIRLA